MPATLRVIAISTTSVRIAWDASLDDIGVTGYDVYINNIKKYTGTIESTTMNSLVADGIFNFAVRAFDSSCHISSLSVTITIKAMAATAPVAGLRYCCFEAAWSLLPNFNALTATKSGGVANVDIDISNSVKNYGIFWEGYINIPTSGIFIFETNSDDGSSFFSYFQSITVKAILEKNSYNKLLWARHLKTQNQRASIFN